MNKKLLKILQSLGWQDKKKDEFTPEEISKVNEELQAKYGLTIVQLSEQEANEQANQETATAFGNLMQKLNTATGEDTPEETDASDSSGTSEKTETPKGSNNNVTIEAINQKVDSVLAENKRLKTENKTMSQKIHKDVDPITNKQTSVHMNHSETHLFGVDKSFFQKEKAYNVLFLDKEAKGTLQNAEEIIQADFKEYSEDFVKHVQFLHQQNLLHTVTQGESVDYSAFDDFAGGHQFIARRQDAIINYLYKRRKLSELFNVHSNVQDKEALINSFLGDFSQPHQSGEVFKGGIKLEPELAEVHKVMLQFKFDEMDKLEKEYVGYLNKEGSDPIKYTFIEWIMVKVGEKLIDEQELRRIHGFPIKPENGKAGHCLHGSYGLIHRVYKCIEAGKLTPVMDGGYDPSTILDYVEDMVSKVNEQVPSLNGLVLYMNASHVPWYKKAYRKAYGTNTDFDGNLKVQDFDVTIKGVPNMNKSKLMFITQPENCELLEDKTGEMFGFYFERRLQNLVVASYWKEGIAFIQTGNKDIQFVFTNAPFVELTENATTIDARNGDYFRTGVNTAVKTISGITNAQKGYTFKIECGDTTNVTKIAKTGVFANLKDAWIPTKVGDFIKLSLGKDGKFIEAERKVS
jgi:hypothetical protein